MKNKREWGRVLKFTLFSISAGAIEMASFALLNELLHGSYWPCYLIALTLSVLWNFTLNRKFTFQSANNVPQAMALVLLYYSVPSRPCPPCWAAIWRIPSIGTSIW